MNTLKNNLENGAVVSVRGFYYHTPTDLHLLLERPNLKSCCAGKVPLKEQLILENMAPPYPSNASAVTIRGKVRISQEDSAKEPLAYLAVEKVEAPAGVSLAMSGLVVGVIAVIFLLYRVLK